MVNRIKTNANALDLSNINGVLNMDPGAMKEKSQEMLTVEGLQCQLVELQHKGERIIMEATSEIQKRNACLQEGLRVVNLCRNALIQYKEDDGGNVHEILEQIDRWAGPPTP